MRVMDDMDIVDLGPAARQLADLVAHVTDGELGKPTPCPAYTLGDLVEHVGGLALAFKAAANKDRSGHSDRGPSGDASRLSEGWRARIPRDLAALAQAWRKPDAWAGMTRIAGMDAPAAMVGLTAADELVVHGWDVARATGQPYHATLELLGAAHSFLTQIASPDAPAGPDVPFGPPRPVPGNAPLLDRVVALAGRDPAWSPRLIAQGT
jgi:uncharacterized protein (TIGR03086 family)